MKNLASYIDHTNLRPTASSDDIEILCKQARQYAFKAVCINGCYVDLAHSLLKDSGILVATVVGFPLGSMTTKAKLYETQDLLLKGADEIDMVIHVPSLVAKQYDHVAAEIRQLKAACGDRVLKVIVETCYLTDEQIKTASQIVVDTGADFIKTSTGFGTGGATLEHVALMKSVVGDQAKIKASGGIRTLADAQAMIDAGADRLGMSGGVSVMQELAE